jgi:hypothetical protein
MVCITDVIIYAIKFNVDDGIANATEGISIFAAHLITFLLLQNEPFTLSQSVGRNLNDLSCYLLLAHAHITIF